ncbi:MAG TPA: DUF3820 family protein [Ktedonobacteraceae bacterium]|jgi:uncharacterized protein (DUF3820 family)|nr:DUF3820 family protein [Ktedonobacteraceae bacterium]
MRTIETGKYKGKTLANCPVEYLKWASKHEHVYAKGNRWVSQDAKFLLEKEEVVVIDHEIPFGRYRGQKLSQLSRDYLVWMQDADYNPKPIIRNGVDWTELAIQELGRRRQAVRQEIEESLKVFSYLPDEKGDRLTEILADELVKSGVSFSGSNDVENMLLKAGYRGMGIRVDPLQIFVRASLIKKGQLPQYNEKGDRVN